MGLNWGAVAAGAVAGAASGLQEAWKAQREEAMRITEMMFRSSEREATQEFTRGENKLTRQQERDITTEKLASEEKRAGEHNKTQISTANISAGASKYSSDNSLRGTMHTSDTSADKADMSDRRLQVQVLLAQRSQAAKDLEQASRNLDTEGEIAARGLLADADKNLRQLFPGSQGVPGLIPQNTPEPIHVPKNQQAPQPPSAAEDSRRAVLDRIRSTVYPRGDTASAVGTDIELSLANKQAARLASEKAEKEKEAAKKKMVQSSTYQGGY